MNVSNGMMDIFFGYNTRVGDLQTLNRAEGQYQALAENAETAEDRERYANAVTTIQSQLRPQFEKEVDQLGQSLGLADGQMGQPITKEEYEALKNKKGGPLSYIDNGTTLFSSIYESGSLLSKSV